MSTKSDDFSVGPEEARSEQSMGCEITLSDTRGGGGGSKDRSSDIMGEVSISSSSTDKDYPTVDTRGGGKGSKD